MPRDRDQPGAEPFPTAGVAYGGNSVSPIRWLPWLIGAPLAGSAAWILTWRAASGHLAAALVGIAVTLAVPLVPLELRSYVSPQPPPLHVDVSGLSVYLGNQSLWRAGSYLLLPWHVIAELAVTQWHVAGAALRITVNGEGRLRSEGSPGEVGESLRRTGTAIVSPVPAELRDAVRHYSAERCRVIMRR